VCLQKNFPYLGYTIHHVKIPGLDSLSIDHVEVHTCGVMKPGLRWPGGGRGGVEDQNKVTSSTWAATCSLPSHTIASKVPNNFYFIFFHFCYNFVTLPKQGLGFFNFSIL
jgi:hypothetical protein